MNKYQEALDYLKGGNLFGELSDEALDSILELVDKATPKKSFYHPQWPSRGCPECFINIGDNEYCGNCGQKIDWSDEE